MVKFWVVFKSWGKAWGLERIWEVPGESWVGPGLLRGGLGRSWDALGQSRAALGHTLTRPNRAFAQHGAKLGSKTISRLGRIWDGLEKIWEGFGEGFGKPKSSIFAFFSMFFRSFF